MSFFDRFGKLTDAYGDMDEDYYEPGMDDEPLFEPVEEERPARPVRQRARREKQQSKPRRQSVFSAEDDYDEDEAIAPAAPPKSTGGSFFGSRMSISSASRRSSRRSGSRRKMHMDSPLPRRGREHRLIHRSSCLNGRCCGRRSGRRSRG